MREPLSIRNTQRFGRGRLSDAHRYLGAHLTAEGARFAVWAPTARQVSVVGDFNDWDRKHGVLEAGPGGVWWGYVPGVKPGDAYRYRIRTHRGPVVERSDPYAFATEVSPQHSSLVWDLGYRWSDGDWMERRRGGHDPDGPLSTYEVHLGSWMKKRPSESYSYRELAPRLVEYVTDLGFTHVEFLPVTEHPYYPSWGYQTTGYFAPTSRYGRPQDFMFLVDRLHQAGIGVILDWVPSHFAADEYGLFSFDGTACYEHPDPRRGWHPDWHSAIFDYGRPEVRSFLISSANFWLDRYHVDGIRVDAVASMLYLDYSRKDGEWEPNVHGGREHLEAIDFLRDLNPTLLSDNPGTFTVAEESTAWPRVSRPVEEGGLGFVYKWDLGWMNDTLSYLSHWPEYRTMHQDELTFRMLYAYNENFILPLSHDEVVHAKGSMIRKMSGRGAWSFDDLRALYGYMYGLPGKKLLFMGDEFAQRSEWNHDTSLDWRVLRQPRHLGMQRWVRDLNHLYREHPALWVRDRDQGGFGWIDTGHQTGIVAWNRYGHGTQMLVVCNFTGQARKVHRIGVGAAGEWRVVLNSDARRYGGQGRGPRGKITTRPVAAYGRRQSLQFSIPPLGAIFLQPIVE